MGSSDRKPGLLTGIPAGLEKKLLEYAVTDHYPFHMPGHKRNPVFTEDPFRIDITEIDGFDNLHHAEGILKEAEQRAAALYHSEETCFLVNGSSCGLLAAVSACARQGRREAGEGKEEILMARNCHKAAYHAAELNWLEVRYLYPERREDGLNGPIDPDEVEEALRQKVPCAVLITSPTYDGVVSDVKKIAGIVHRYNTILIVDAAHGAHFGMHPFLPENAVAEGADLVIHSLHKTLPALTQTALLHMNGPRIDRSEVRQMLGIYETSSPSYVLMASMDSCVCLLEERGKELFDRFMSELFRTREKLKGLKNLKLLETDDFTKVIISVGNTGMCGLDLAKALRERFHLEMEMAARQYVLALTSVGDTDRGLERLADAVIMLDGEFGRSAGKTRADRKLPAVSPVNERACSIFDARTSLYEVSLLEESEGRVCAEYVYLYPPGIPLLVPGERIGRERILELREYMDEGFELEGMRDLSGRTIRVMRRK